jgi:hypothetical protein
MIIQVIVRISNTDCYASHFSIELCSVNYFKVDYLSLSISCGWNI